MANPDKWVISDLHLGHANILTFSSDGKPVREFTNVDEMNETIIERWNKVVKQQDVVYFLGDMVINKKFLPLVYRLQGSKRLIKGNHDIEKDDKYLPYFKTIYAMRIFKDMILTHIPISDQCIGRFKLCIHGHIHQHSIHDPRYRNVCCDFPGDEFYPSMNYTPISLEQIRDDARNLGLYS